MFTNTFAVGATTYPSPRPFALQDRYAGFLRAQAGSTASVAGENVLFTQGSVAAIDLLIRAFCEPHTDVLAVSSPTFPVYRQLAIAGDIAFIDVPLAGAFDRLDIERLAEAKAKLIFVCNPTSPVGSLIPLADIQRLTEACSGLVVVDEAYIEFADAVSAISLVAPERNLVVLRTLSKAWGLAGLRVGAAVGPKSVLNAMRVLQDPFAFDTAAQQAVGERLSDVPAMRQWVQAICAERGRLTRELIALPIVRRVFPSVANFICVQVADAAAAFKACLEQDVLANDTWGQIPASLRISLGSPEDNDRTLAVLRSIPLSRRDP
jgi:histidinol-phosphate aminotransferase